MNWNQIVTGDCRRVLAKVPANSVQCVVTSPPYWGLRDYEVEGQLGSEPVPDCLGWATKEPCGECYVCHVVEVFRGVRRVLRDDGVVFLNLGDTYANTGGHTKLGETSQRQGRSNVQEQHKMKGSVPVGFKPKDRIGIPHRVAFALQAAGWYFRDEIVWAKPNMMPESVRDRCVKAHEMVFMFSKQPRYYFDSVAIAEPPVTKNPYRAVTKKMEEAGRMGEGRTGYNTRSEGRGKRSVWWINIEGSGLKHFAMFPTGLVQSCVLAGTSKKGCCRKCGCPWRRVLEKTRIATRPGAASKCNRVDPAVKGNRDPLRHVTQTRTVGWEAGCDCGDQNTVPCTVLDPFSGAGTTCCVAKKLRRRWFGIELNPRYTQMSMKRLAKVQVGLV